MRKIENFEEYLDAVVANQSYSNLSNRLHHYAQYKIEEVVRTLYRFDIDYKKASVILESFLKNFKLMLHIPIEEQEDYDYLDDDKYDF